MQPVRKALEIDVNKGETAHITVPFVARDEGSPWKYAALRLQMQARMHIATSLTIVKTSQALPAPPEITQPGNMFVNNS